MILAYLTKIYWLHIFYIFLGYTHRSLNIIWKSIYFLQEEIFVQQGASFVSFSVTKPVVTQGTTRHQMKDIDINFPLISLSFL